ncbi:J domain-containing protein [Desulfitobacterium sp.]|uniref:J domain-containing protein n=1 Tax=Desulfitobacterium sp. TaxID=49981 RepID=UPI002B912CFE|nr:J domain-containing protein [Desulfitobacterium sp.]HVJ48577.1 J domain-containing protein [Desulfitobacterium sp.]
MDFKDYYSILGVSKDADDTSIKKVYQKLAKKYHPDVNPGNKEAEEKFKEVTEAYQAISDPEKRRKYEEVRQNYEAWQKHGGQGDYDWSRWQAQPGEGSHTRTMTPEEFAAMFGDSGWEGSFSGSGGGFSDFFSTLFGMGDIEQGPHHRGHQAARTQTRQDRELKVNISLEEAYHGTTRVIDTGEKRLQAKIPKGVRSGSKVRLAGQGIFLLITLEPHAVYTREGDDLTTDISVNFYKAVLGGEIKVSTLGGEITFKIPPHTQGNTKFRLKGKGMPHLESPNQFGDLYVHIQLTLPSNLGGEERSALQDLATKYQHL